jgi:hypothetical protein
MRPPTILGPLRALGFRDRTDLLTAVQLVPHCLNVVDELDVTARSSSVPFALFSHDSLGWYSGYLYGASLIETSPVRG